MKLRMMALVLSGLGLAAGPAQAQADTELVQHRTNAGVVEEFSVLKADKTVRQGPYLRYHVAGALSGVALYETGQYAQGRKEGEWRCFSETGAWNRLLSKGTYRAGRLHGLWYYYHPVPQPAPLSKMALDVRHLDRSYTVSVEDTLAVVRAKGAYVDGERAGLWRYYNAAGTLIQAVSYPANRLVYGLGIADQPLVGAALASHPLLYAGGKPQLQWEIVNLLDSEFMGQLEGVASTGVMFLVDSTGRQTGVQLATAAAPDRYERLLLAELSRLPSLWVPQAVNGRRVAASYHAVVNIVVSAKGLKANVVPVGY